MSLSLTPICHMINSGKYYSRPNTTYHTVVLSFKLFCMKCICIWTSVGFVESVCRRTQTWPFFVNSDVNGDHVDNYENEDDDSGGDDDDDNDDGDSDDDQGNLSSTLFVGSGDVMC